MGDVVVCSPVVRCVKLQWGCELHFVVKRQFVDVVRDSPYLDRIHVLDDDQRALHKILQAEKYDLVIDLHKNMRSRRILSALSTAAVTYDKLRWEKWLWINFKINRMPDKHLVDRYFDALAPLGLKNDQHGLDYFLSQKDRDVASQFLNLHKITSQYDVIVLGAAHKTKRVPLDLARQIIQSANRQIIIIGGPAEASDGASLQEDSRGKAISACGEMSISQSAALIANCDHVVTGDTGMMHISAAFKKKIVVVWGSTHEDLGMYPYMPFGKMSHYNARVPLACNPCTKIGNSKCPKGHFKCMEQQDAKAISQQIADN